MLSASSRREFVAAAFAPLTAGCSVSPTADDADVATVDATEYDCAAVSRPEPDDPDDEEALEPHAYPDLDSSASFPATAERFVREFEQVYRRNAFIARVGNGTRRIEFHPIEHRVDDGDDAVLVSFVYSLATHTDDTIGDEWGTRVTYYVDERLALRAEYDDSTDEPRFEPDPRDDGTLVACFV